MKDLKDFLKSLKYDTTQYETMQPHIAVWREWYRGKTNFHNYTVYNGDKSYNLTRKSLEMFKKVAEDYANFLLNEKTEYTIGNEATTKLVLDTLYQNDFETLGNEGIEKSIALGTGAFVLGINTITLDTNTKLAKYDKANITIDFVAAENIIPLTYRGKIIQDCAFAVEHQQEGKTYLYVSIHKLINGEYVIENFKLEKNAGVLTDRSEELADTAKIFNTKSDKAWFAILRPPISNSIEDNSPYGMSTLANSIPVLEGIDMAYDSLVNEFQLGKKRIFVSGDLINIDTASGDIKPTYDPNDTIYYTLPELDSDAKNKINEFDPVLRIDAHEKGIQLNLNLLSSKVGFGTDYFKFEKGQIRTATEVVSNSSDLYRNIQKYANSVRCCLCDLFIGILSIHSTFLNNKVDVNSEISIDFDDSIVEDTAETKRQAMLEFNTGLIDSVQYYQDVYKLTEKQAIVFDEKIKERLTEGIEDDTNLEDE